LDGVQRDNVSRHPAGDHKGVAIQVIPHRRQAVKPVDLRGQQGRHKCEKETGDIRAGPRILCERAARQVDHDAGGGTQNQ